MIGRVGNVAEAIDDSNIHDTTVDFSTGIVLSLDEELGVYSYEHVEESDAFSGVSDESDVCCQIAIVRSPNPLMGYKNSFRERCAENNRWCM